MPFEMLNDIHEHDSIQRLPPPIRPDVYPFMTLLQNLWLFIEISEVAIEHIYDGMLTGDDFSSGHMIPSHTGLVYADVHLLI